MYKSRATIKSGKSPRHTQFANKKNTGDYGEKIACGYLLDKGYTIIDTKYTVSGGEVDIIAFKAAPLPNNKALKNSLQTASFSPDGSALSQQSSKARGLLVFIEVKTLPHGSPELLSDVVGYKKQKAVSKTANIFVLHNRKYSDCKIRFDVIAIDVPGYPKVYHIKNAFEYIGDFVP